MFKNSKIPIWLRLWPRKWLYNWHLTLTLTPKKIFKVTPDSEFDAKNIFTRLLTLTLTPIFDFQFDFQIWFSIWLSWSLTPKKNHSRRTLILISMNYTYFPKEIFIRRRLVLFYTMRLWAEDHFSELVSRLDEIGLGGEYKDQ